MITASAPPIKRTPIATKCRSLPNAFVSSTSGMETTTASTDTNAVWRTLAP